MAPTGKLKLTEEQLRILQQSDKEIEERRLIS